MAVRRLTHNQFGDDNAYTIMRDKGEFIDAILCSNQTPSKKVLAHRPVLAAVSSIFKKKFKRSPDISLPIVLKNVNHQKLAELIEFIYNGEIFIPDDSFDDFCSLYNCYNITLGKEIDKKLKGECNSEEEDNDLDIPTPEKRSKHDSIETIIKVEKDNKPNLEKVTQLYFLGKRKYDEYDHTEQVCTHDSYDEKNCPLMNPEVGWPSFKYGVPSPPPSPTLPDSLFQDGIDKQMQINANPLKFAGISILKQKPKLADYKKAECEYEEEDLGGPDVKPQINSGIVSSTTNHPEGSSLACTKWIKTEAGSSGDRTNINHSSNRQHISQNCQRKEETREKNTGISHSIPITTGPSVENGLGQFGPSGLFKKGPGGLYWILMQNISDEGRTSEEGIKDTLERFGKVKDFLRNPSIPHVAYVAFRNEEEAMQSIKMLKLCQKEVGNTCTNVTELPPWFNGKYPPIPVTGNTPVNKASTSFANTEQQPPLAPSTDTQPGQVGQLSHTESRFSNQMRSDSEFPPTQDEFGFVRVYIGNLPNKETDVNSLRRLFDDCNAPYLDCVRGNSNYGIEIRHKLNYIPVKCIAFVYCKNSEDANIFVNNLNGKIYKNRQITVKLPIEDDVKVYVGNLPFRGTDVRSLRRLFNNHDVPYLRIDLKKGHAFVHCKDHRDADTFINALNGEFFKNRHITAKLETPRNSRGRNSVEKEFSLQTQPSDYKELSFEEEIELVKEKMRNARASTQKEISPHKDPTDFMGRQADSTSPYND